MYVNNYNFNVMNFAKSTVIILFYYKSILYSLFKPLTGILKCYSASKQ